MEHKTKQILGAEADVLVRHSWEPRADAGAPLLEMNNVPLPLHTLAPRTVLGQPAWDIMRRACYKRANDTCEICGERPAELRNRHAHELYKVDYDKGEEEFLRTICLCHLCHNSIHTGRMLTLYTQGNLLMPRPLVLTTVEKAFKLVYEYNEEHGLTGTDDEIRLYHTYIDILKTKSLQPDVLAIWQKYPVKFWAEKGDMTKEWEGWKLKIGNKWYNGKFKSREEWEKAMQKMNKRDTMRRAPTQKIGGAGEDAITDLVKEILGDGAI